MGSNYLIFKMMKKELIVILFFAMLTSCVHTEVEVNGNLTGSAREKGSAKAIGGCSISLEPGNNQIYSSEDGSYSFNDLLMGEYTLTASKEGYMSLVENITVPSGKTLNHDIMLTPAIVPTVSTDSVSNLQANSATLCGAIVDKGGVSISKRGFYFGNDTSKLTAVYVTERSDTLLYNLIDLVDGEKYYYQAFAFNEVGEGKGELKFFMTKELFAPSVKTSSSTNIGTTTAMLHGEITDNGNSKIFSCGFYAGLTPTPDQKYSYGSNEESILGLVVNNLKSKTTYYYCIFAENQKGETKGDVLSFETLDTSKPIVYTNNATDITASSATLHATLSDYGGCEVTEYGFYIGTSSSSLSKQKVVNIQNNLFTYSYGNLQDGTTYYFQAYAINEKGESKGEILSFKTVQLALPELQTYDVVNVGYTSALLQAVITSNGSSTIKEYGFYYGIYSNPTTKVKVGSGNIQKYSYSLNALTANTMYYVKAYAINDKGEECGGIKSFLTLTYSAPKVQTNSATNVTDRSAICTGVVISDGGSDILEQGICYSQSRYPTINGEHVNSSVSSTTISCNITGLEFAKTYYYRAFARNSIGISYGAEQSFTTEDAPYSAGLNGRFSISNTQQVIFSGGNLRYNASTNEWQFAKHQYDIVGADNANISDNYNGWIDLFGWGTGNNPTQTSTYSRDYMTFTDWGNNTINGVSGQWRTLSDSEWNYLLNRSTTCATFAIVNGVNGWILLPDNWTLPQGITMEFYYLDSYVGYSQVDVTQTKNKYSITQWSTLEAAGAVFLPVTGRRTQYYGITVENYSGSYQEAYYWSSTSYGIYGNYINNNKTNQKPNYSYYNSSSYYGEAHAVRLIQVK